MKISACYIVKDEEKNLAQSIGSLRDAVDEIIVADTGSEDNTIAVARQLGAAVYSFPWQEDFAAARNFALSRATGDWLILLDADEYFTESTAGNIRSLLAGAAQEVNGLLIQMVNYDTDRQVEQDRFYQLRIVRNLPGLSYEGIVHERLRLKGGDIPGVALVKSNLLEIYHTGYRTESSEAKSRRNLRLLQKALAAGSSEAELSLYLCVTYAALKEWDKALHYGWLNVHQGRSSITYAAQCHRILLEYYADKDNWEA
ncbi:MAG: glycosyltransferase family 2 protein, partial [Selenomonadaceae bacterium]|nr:glycosyltransferase family 2 protein [Selenomonadaceae bacterium]